MLDYLAIAALTAELRQRLLGTRVQAVIGLDRFGLTLELFGDGRWYLRLSADPQHSGFGLQRARVRRGVGPATPLVLAARGRLLGTRLQAIEQPPCERVLCLTFDSHPPCRLVIELMGRLANVVLLDADERVVSVARPVTPGMSRVRSVLPGRHYEPPPQPHKPPLTAVTPSQIAAWLAEEPDRPAWRLLCDRLRAVSPLLAREAVHRALTGERQMVQGRSQTGDQIWPAGSCPAHGVHGGRLHATLSALLALPQTAAWEPGVSRSGEAVTAYAPYRLHHLPGWQPTESLVAAMALWEAERRGADAYAIARRELGAQVEGLRRRALRRLTQLESQQPDLAMAESDRLKGDLILAFRQAIEPGQRQLVVSGLEGEATWTIDLDPALPALANAQRYYRRYRRARRAAQALPALVESARLDVAALDQLAVDVQLAEDRAQLEAVRQALQVLTGPGRPKEPRPPRGRRPLCFTSAEGFPVLVGRNSLENELVTFRLAHRNDLWLHARDHPGGHVVIQSGGREVPPSTLELAAGLAAHYSRARGESHVAVVVTAVRNVHRVAGGVAGMVRYRSNSTLIVRPVAPPPA